MIISRKIRGRLALGRAHDSATSEAKFNGDNKKVE